MNPEEEKAFTAVAIGERDRLKTLLDARPDLVNARNDDGDSLLLTAAYSGRKDVFDLLLEKGAGVNVFEASALGLSDRVGEFLRADPPLANTYSSDRWTPLHLRSFLCPP